MLTDSLVEAFRVRLEALGFDLADLRIGGTPNRPLVQVRIDWPPDSPGSGAGATSPPTAVRPVLKRSDSAAPAGTKPI